MFIIATQSIHAWGGRLYWTGTSYGWTMHGSMAHQYATLKAAQRAISRQRSMYCWRTTWDEATIEEIEETRA